VHYVLGVDNDGEMEPRHHSVNLRTCAYSIGDVGLATRQIECITTYNIRHITVSHKLRRFVDSYVELHYFSSFLC